MGSETTILSEKSKLFAWGLQMMAGILLAIVAWFLKDAHASIECLDKAIQQCEMKIVRSETRLDNQDTLLKEIRDDVKALINRRP